MMLLAKAIDQGHLLQAQDEVTMLLARLPASASQIRKTTSGSFRRILSLVCGNG